MDHFLFLAILIVVFIVIIIIIIVSISTTSSTNVVLPPVNEPPNTTASPITYSSIFNLTAIGINHGPVIRCNNRNSCGDRAIIGRSGDGERFRFIALNGTAGPVRFGDNVKISSVAGGFLELCVNGTNRCGREIVLGGNSSGTIWRIATLTGAFGTVVNNTNSLVLSTIVDHEVIYLTSCDELAVESCQGGSPLVASRRVSTLYWRINSVP